MGSDERHIAPKIHDIPIVHGPQGSHLAFVAPSLGFGEYVFVGFYLVERTVAEYHHLIEIVPCGKKGVVGRSPRVFVESLPEAAVIPVATTDGEHLFVGGERVPVIDSAIGALKSLAFVMAADVVV